MENPETITYLKHWLGNGAINLFGRPFAGKDSQGKILATLFDGNLLGGGDILRNSVIPDDVKTIMRAGQLIPSEAYVKIVLPYLSKAEFANKPLLLSSVGRWHGEEDGVVTALESSHHPLKAVIYLDLEEETVHKRWHDHENRKDRSERHDDSEAVLETRFTEFREKTLPVIDYYDQLGIMIRVDATDSRETVTDQIISALIILAQRDQA